MYKERSFYLACFKYIGQNSLFETLFNVYYELWIINLDLRYMASNVKLSEAELDVMAKLNAHALVGIINDWTKNGMDNDYMNYFEQVRKLLEMEYFTIVPEKHPETKEYMNIA